ncbi:MAG: hypothetical protein M1834_009560 [Cirrosporium novae-zelandiae]|nr:MAG: hypothetical protein M1834_009560 [Cirrosporium novae-zelandiae]
MPGLSFGVLHHREGIHQANFGFRDIDAQLCPDENTTYVIGSLTKALTAAMVAILVDEGKLDWTTQLQDITPQFQRPEKDPTNNITIADLLSHRTGLPSYDALWLLSDNRVSLDRADAVPILGYVPCQAIEKVPGAHYFLFLRNHILDPLGMTRTFYTNFSIHAENTAKPYATLENATAFQLPPPLHGDNFMVGSAGGVRSSVHDLLILYNAFIDAAKIQIEHHKSKIPRNPLKKLAHLWRGMITLPLSTILENSYASGWVRVQLPAPIGFGAAPGNIPGFTSFAAVFPETSSAVVILSNSVALTGGVRLVGQLLIEELFGNTINVTDYTQYARLAAKRSTSTMETVKKKLIQGKTVDRPARSLQKYLGKYYNSIGNFFIDVRERAGNLQVCFMGLDSDGFDLEPYQHNSLFWHMSHNECIKYGRCIDYPKEYYVINFGNADGNGHDSNETDINCLWWKHEFTVPGNGEVFRKSHQLSQ